MIDVLAIVRKVRPVVTGKVTGQDGLVGLHVTGVGIGSGPRVSAAVGHATHDDERSTARIGGVQSFARYVGAGRYADLIDIEVCIGFVYRQLEVVVGGCPGLAVASWRGIVVCVAISAEAAVVSRHRVSNGSNARRSDMPFTLLWVVCGGAWPADWVLASAWRTLADIPLQGHLGVIVKVWAEKQNGR